jgi:hypothetical protein
MKQTMETKEIKGIKENLIFYYPPNSNKLYAQRYNVETDEVVYESEVLGQEHYEIKESMFRMFNNPDKKMKKDLCD